MHSLRELCRRRLFIHTVHAVAAVNEQEEPANDQRLKRGGSKKVLFCPQFSRSQERSNGGGA